MGLVPPVDIRAETYKQEIREAESIKYKLENKEHDIKDLRRALKEKSEELSEMNVRKDKAEKRLQVGSLNNNPQFSLPLTPLATQFLPQ